MSQVRIIEIAPGWLPTTENVNALPDPLRRYIHDLETRCDPSGEVLEAYGMRQQISALEAMVLKLRGAEPEDLEAIRRKVREFDRG